MKPLWWNRCAGTIAVKLLRSNRCDVFVPSPMPNSYPFPPLQVFERLHINDGLLMTADLWQRAHGYHRQRQDFTFQALFYPGIVYGLEVVVIPAPADVPGPYRDGRWLEIQPGTAIDVAGRPIVVPEPITFRIESEPSPHQPSWIYLTVRHVDPDTLQPDGGGTQRSGRTPQQVIRTEQFRIVEKMTLDVNDIELCRILLLGADSGRAIALRPAANVFSPGQNEIDLRHRPQIQRRPQGVVSVAQLTANTAADQAITTQLSYLLKATASLYPQLSGYEAIELIATHIPEAVDATGARMASSLASDSSTGSPMLVYCPWLTLQTLAPDATERLATALNQGGILLVGVTAQEAGLTTLYSLRQELETALNGLDSSTEVTSMRQSLTAELAAFDQDINQHVQRLVTTLRSIVGPLGHPLVGPGHLDSQHPLRLEPFLFGQWPVVNDIPLTVLQWGTVILVVGDLATWWGPDETLQRSRHSIRTAQELGINLLNFAWQHYHLSQLQGGYITPPAPDGGDALRDRISPIPR